MRTYTVITANYNSGVRLSETAQSVLGQCADIEYIIVDGASTDGSLETARILAEGHPGDVVLISEPDRGIYDAMNKGLQAAQGRYIYFLGAGDRLLPASLKSVERVLPSHNKGFVYGDVLWSGKLYDGPFEWRKLVGANICHQAIFYGREVFKMVGYYDLRYKLWADWEMNLRCFGCRSIPKHYVPLTIAEFEEGGASMGGDPVFERERIWLIRKRLGMIRYCQVKRYLIAALLRRQMRRVFGCLVHSLPS